jgi:hypothetical protein
MTARVPEQVDEAGAREHSCDPLEPFDVINNARTLVHQDTRPYEPRQDLEDHSGAQVGPPPQPPTGCAHGSRRLPAEQHLGNDADRTVIHVERGLAALLPPLAERFGPAQVHLGQAVQLGMLTEHGRDDRCVRPRRGEQDDDVGLDVSRSRLHSSHSHIRPISAGINGSSS